MTEMAWDGVPWMVGGGVKHSTNVARLLAFAAFGGQEGIINPLDLEVRERDVPDGTIRVAPGACSILNRNPSVEYDAYAARLPIEDVVAIGPTGSGGYRTDLVVARIENPFLSGEPYPEPSPEDIAAGLVQFVRTHVYPGVLSGAGAAQHPTAAQIKAAIGTDSAIPLATIALPASTGTIAQGYIRDQRRIAQFREAQTMRIVNPTASVTLNDGTWKNIASTSVAIPEWATHFTTRGMVGGAAFAGPQSRGGLRMVLGGTLTESTTFDERTDKGTDRATLMCGDSDTAIPVIQRGTSQNLVLQGSKSSGTNMVIDTWCTASLEVVFESRPEHDAT